MALRHCDDWLKKVQAIDPLRMKYRTTRWIISMGVHLYILLEGCSSSARLTRVLSKVKTLLLLVHNGFTARRKLVQGEHAPWEASASHAEPAMRRKQATFRFPHLTLETGSRTRLVLVRAAIHTYSCPESPCPAPVDSMRLRLARTPMTVKKSQLSSSTTSIETRTTLASA